MRRPVAEQCDGLRSLPGSYPADSQKNQGSIKRVFRLTLRAAQGFIDSIFSLMNVPLRCPDYSCALTCR
ncbi:hypothetical protein CLI88_15105 [Klebsiella pneumoniae]|nr:hypothetical protein CLI88_15105 [Klebsiella pneumoniae]